MRKIFLKSFSGFRGLGIVSLFIFQISNACASTPTELYNEGNHAYLKGEYSKAYDFYARALEQGATDPDLYYNIGNASFKTGKSGLAVLYYRKAMRLDPSDKKIAGNLDFVKSGLKDKIDEPEKGVITGFLRWCFTLMSLNGFFIATLAPYLLLSVMLFFVISGKRSLTKPILLLSLPFLVLSLFLLAKIYDERLSGPEGVVVVEEVKARSEPKKDGETVFTIHEGTAFEINEEQGAWVLITLPTGWSGWVNRSGIEII